MRDVANQTTIFPLIEEHTGLLPILHVDKKAHAVLENDQLQRMATAQSVGKVRRRSPQQSTATAGPSLMSLVDRGQGQLFGPSDE